MEKYNISNVHKVDAGEPPVDSRGWKAFDFNFHNFEKLPSTKGEIVKSPKVTGHEWSLLLCPGGYLSSTDGYISLFFKNHNTKAGNISIDFVFLITDLDENAVVKCQYGVFFVMETTGELVILFSIQD